MIDVSPSDFLKIPGYAGIVRMLQALEEAGSSGLSTNEAGLKVFHSRTHGWRTLKRANEMGYITREVVHKEKSIGHYRVVNKLSDKGRRLLEELK
jgi:hypothetical protein